MVTWSRARAAFVFLIVAAMLGFVAAPASADSWRPGNSAGTARYGATAVTLPDGRILVIGGSDSTGTPSNVVEAYTPATGTWKTLAPMVTARMLPLATTVGDGTVLVVSDTDAEVYNPATNTWRPTANRPRDPHGSGSAPPIVSPSGITRLPDGRALIAGASDAPATVHADLYDPDTTLFSAAPDMGTARATPSQALLPNGKVLVVGGADAGGPLATGEVYDPVANRWAPVSNSMTSGHTAPIVQPLTPGKVLVAGGYAAAGFTGSTASEVYDVATSRFTPTGAMTTSRILGLSAVLSGGRVLVAGGLDSSGGPGSTPVGTVEIYDPVTGRWRAGSPMTTAVSMPAAVPLGDGSVLAVGGVTFSGGIPAAVSQTQVYVPSVAPGAPRGVVAFAGNSTAAVSWSAPDSDGGGTVSGYTVRASTGAVVELQGAATSTVLSGLTNGTPVTFTVTARNSAGFGPASAPSAAVTPSAPSAPSAPVAPDTAAPNVGIRGVHKKMKVRKFRKGVLVKVRTSEQASLKVELLARAKHANLGRLDLPYLTGPSARPSFNLTLATKSFALGGSRTAKLKPLRKLIGKAHRFRVQVRVVATDAAGNRSTTTRTIRVR